MITRHNWIAGTLELTSKVRYGLTARGVPIFRFIPYDKRFPPLAVGCSHRNLFYNVHAIVEPATTPTRPGELQKGTLIQNLGTPTQDSEKELLVATYVQDSRKELRKFPADAGESLSLITGRNRLSGITFHIDPPGCRDVDDTFTLSYNPEYACWDVAINIADVAEYVKEGSALDSAARQRATSFYTPLGHVVTPMLPPELSEGLISLLPGSPKLTLSLQFEFYPATKEIQNIRWEPTETVTNLSYTYAEADEQLAKGNPELLALKQIAQTLGLSAAPPDFSGAHEIVEKLMVFYNNHAGKTLAASSVGILRRHKQAKAARISRIMNIAGVPEFLAYDAAEFCLPTDENTWHWGLGYEFYAYASSPLRRYADLVNQRSIKELLKGEKPNPTTQELIDDLNRRQKQEKAFSRDLFFMTSLAQNPDHKSVEGIVVDSEGTKTRLWVAEWKRVITVKSLEARVLEQGTRCKVQWYADPGQARWKDKIVFKAEAEADAV